MAEQLVTTFQETLGPANATGNIQDRLIAPCAIVDAGGSVSADIPALLNRLLIFKNYYLQSIRLREFASLVRTLGLDNVILLLDSGALKIDLNPTQFGQSGQTDPQLGIREKPSLPLLSYSFSLLFSAQRNDYLLRSVQEVHRELRDVIGWRELTRLEGAILRAVIPLPENTGVPALLAFDGDLKANSPIFKKALLNRLGLKQDFVIAESDLSLVISQIDDTDFAVETNLESFGLTREEAHKFVESALLGAGYLNRRIEDMENYHALSGVIDDELFLFGEKLKLLAACASPTHKEKTFDKALRIGRFPAFDLQPPTKLFNIDRFLTVRDSKECKEFRDWLRNAQFLDEREIQLQVGSLRTRLGTLVHGTTGRIIRFAVSNLAGVNPVVGWAVSALDTFVLDTIFPLSGPAMFLDSMYGSLFAERHKVVAKEP